MFGKLLGKALSLPIDIVNVPVKVLDEVADVVDAGGSGLPEAIDDLSDEVQNTVEDIFGS